VKTNLTTTNGLPAWGGTCSAAGLLAALTPEQRQDLRNFAAKRLARVARVPSRRRLLSIISSPEDLVGRAVQAVLLGEERPGEGRRLSAKNRRSTAAFVAGLRSVVDSQLSNLTRSAEANSEHVPVGTREDPDAVELADLSDLARLIERRDLKAVLFRHLREWSAGHAGLRRVIGAWEQSFDGGDRIGETRFDRNLAQRVRSETQAFLLKLARESDSQARSGRGMVW